MKTWFNLNKKDDGTTPVLSIFDDIGAYGVSAKDFINQLNSISGEEVSVEINSPGGDVFAGLAIHNSLRACGKTVNVKVMGLAASAASLVAMAGDSIEMPENTFMMVHNPWGFAMGNADEMRSTADVLDKIGASLASTYAKRTGKSDDEITALLNAETWMTAQEALDAGFATKVTPALAVNASFDVERLPENVRAAFFAQAPAVKSKKDEPPAPQEQFEPFASKVQAMAEAAGLAAYAAHWAADPSLDTVEAVSARVELAREIVALCGVAKMPEKADSYIKAAASLQSVRADIFAALDTAYEHIDTTPKEGSKKPQSSGAKSASIKGADIWAARRQKTAI